jgi:hypothetical protein
MSSQTVCQWLIVASLVVSFLVNAHIDCHGRKAKEPKGFDGLLSTILATAISAAVIWGAGGFSALFGR